MRLIQVFIVAVAFLAASAASAIEMVISSTVNGDQTTIEIALSNNDGSAVQGIEIDLTGLAGVANVVSGQASRYNFAQACFGSPIQCFGGVESVKNAFFDRDDLRGGGYAAGDNQVELLRSLALGATTASGAGDPGLGPQSVDIRVVLAATGGGNVNIVGRYSNGTDVLPFGGGSVSIIPEPGTAVLMGLGLAGLAGAGRRR